MQTAAEWGVIMSFVGFFLWVLGLGGGKWWEAGDKTGRILNPGGGHYSVA